MNVLGWDIGGANLKVSNGATRSVEVSFALWKQPDQLTAAIAELASQLFEPADLWVVTMTGELADCFRTKREGVGRILNSVREASGGTPVLVWTTSGEFVPVDEVIEWPILAAASNWLALATWVGRMAMDGNSLLVDIGSTTTDIIPIRNGFPDPEGRTDVERLLSGELVYTGWKRTPLAALAADVQFRGQRCPLAAELFATTWDIHLLTEAVAESGETNTANGGPASLEGAYDRLSRMLCGDREEVTLEEAREIARELTERQVDQIRSAISRVVQRMTAPCPTVIVSGSGEFLATMAVRRTPGLEASELHSLGAILGHEHATTACAFAIARLAREQIQ